MIYLETSKVWMPRDTWRTRSFFLRFFFSVFFLPRIYVCVYSSFVKESRAICSAVSLSLSSSSTSFFAKNTYLAPGWHIDISRCLYTPLHRGGLFSSSESVCFQVALESDSTSLDSFLFSALFSFSFLSSVSRFLSFSVSLLRSVDVSSSYNDSHSLCRSCR